MHAKRIAGAIVLLALVSAMAVAPAGADSEERSAAAQAAVDHLAAELGAAALDGVVITDEYTSKHNDVTHVYLRQAVDGTPVLGQEATVNVQDGAVVHSGHRFVVPEEQEAGGEVVLSPAQALAAAAAAVGAAVTDVRGTPEVAYRAFDDNSGRARLAYNVQVVVPSHWWNLSIDAENGDVVHKSDFVDHENRAHVAATTARPESHGVAEAMLDAQSQMPPSQANDGSSYVVYAMPMESPNDGPRRTVFNPADADASPFGWHDTNGVKGPEYTITRGNNVNAYHDSAADNAADPASQPDGGTGLDFNHPIFTFDATPAAYRDAAVDNLFYWNNVMHDVTSRLGFDEEAGNFQQTNYSGTGTGNDPVLAEAQDGSFVLNANFATPAEGSSPRMQMFLWVDAFDTLGLGVEDVVRQYSTQVRDGDVDGGVIAHEYGHGISNRLVGGPSNVNCVRTYLEAEGEGWSDYWSYALTMRPGDDGATPRGIGTYVTYQDEGRESIGIRNTPYSTDFKINPSTYNTIRTAIAPHGVGYVWATYLWDMYWNLVDAHGFNPNPYDAWNTGGNNLAMQLVIDGMKFAPCGPSFVDARDAIIAADAALTGNPAGDVPGQNECLLWKTFARRGMGYSASAGTRQSKTDQTEAYDLPPQCA